MFRAGKTLHQSFANSNSIVLHNHSVFPEFEDWKTDLLQEDGVSNYTRKRRSRDQIDDFVYRITKRVPLVSSRKGIDETAITLQLTQRNTPSLFGAGSIEEIPDSAIEAIAKEQKENWKADSRKNRSTSRQHYWQIRVAWAKSHHCRNLQSRPVLSNLALIQRTQLNLSYRAPSMSPIVFDQVPNRIFLRRPLTTSFPLSGIYLSLFRLGLPTNEIWDMQN